MKKEPLFELRNVSKIYKVGVDVVALDHVDLTLFKGEFISITGASGSGKSTLMHMIGLLDSPSSGHIYFNDKRVSQIEDSELSKIRGSWLGFIFQQFYLIPTLTALENVRLPMILQGNSDEKTFDRARELLELVGLGDRVNHKPNELSGGQQQRVAIARALANNPDIILADEPTGNLDSKSGREIMDLLGKLNKNEKKTIVLVTHDQKLVKFARRNIVLKDGKILSDT
jgi:putative ABC transport system ATP-binding protein